MNLTWINGSQLNNVQLDQVLDVYPTMQDVFLRERSNFPFYKDTSTLNTNFDPVEDVEMARLQFEDNRRISNCGHVFYDQAARLGSLG